MLLGDEGTVNSSGRRLTFLKAILDGKFGVYRDKNRAS
jgi:hypothetical protein